MNEFKAISKRVKNIQDNLNKKSYKRIPSEKQIWACKETGELCYYEDFSEITEESLIQDLTGKKYIISQQDGSLGNTKRIVCIGEVQNIYNIAPDSSNSIAKFEGKFCVFYYTNGVIEQIIRNYWWIGNYTDELMSISEETYLNILYNKNSSPESIFSMIDELNYDQHE
jgi:hypothetical protein